MFNKYVFFSENDCKRWKGAAKTVKRGAGAITMIAEELEQRRNMVACYYTEHFSEV